MDRNQFLGRNERLQMKYMVLPDGSCCAFKTGAAFAGKNAFFVGIHAEFITNDLFAHGYERSFSKKTAVLFCGLLQDIAAKDREI